MAKTQPDSRIKFEANLWRKLLDIRFTLSFSTTMGRPSRRKEKYRFRIPFLSLENLYEIESETGYENGVHRRSLLISLQHPPQMWRRIHDVPLTHDKQAKIQRWTEWDTWFRQTDIVENPLELESQPLAIRKKRPTIDIGRWTTYKFVFQLDDTQNNWFDKMIRALKDFNVPTFSLLDFELTLDQGIRVWDVIDPPENREPFKTSIMELTDAYNPLPFVLRYQLEACISHGCLSEYNMSQEFIERLASLDGQSKGAGVKLLESIVDKGKRFFTPMDIFDEKPISHKRVKIPKYCIETRKATVTPTMIYYSNPVIETSNRVIRHYEQYEDRFLRVQFTDEKLQGRVSATEENNSNEIFTRVKRAMINGIKIGERHFSFLAFGNSQLRQHGAYFFCETEDLKCDDIRKWMGEFDQIKVIAKYAARLGQCFCKFDPRHVHTRNMCRRLE